MRCPNCRYCVQIPQRRWLTLNFSCMLVFRAQEPRTIKKLVELDEHIAMAFSGLNADARILVDKVRP